MRTAISPDSIFNAMRSYGITPDLLEEGYSVSQHTHLSTKTKGIRGYDIIDWVDKAVKVLLSHDLDRHSVKRIRKPGYYQMTDPSQIEELHDLYDEYLRRTHDRLSHH